MSFSFISPKNKSLRKEINLDQNNTLKRIRINFLVFKLPYLVTISNFVLYENHQRKDTH